MNGYTVMGYTCYIIYILYIYIYILYIYVAWMHAMVWSNMSHNLGVFVVFNSKLQLWGEILSPKNQKQERWGWRGWGEVK